jgi:riboflavin kinase/FMN adenylyltransferase
MAAVSSGIHGTGGMRVSHGLDAVARIAPGAAISVGNFDGVHLGHRGIIESLKHAPHDGPVALVTFEPHPLTVLNPNLAPPRLTPPAVKDELLAGLGVDELVVLPPSQDVLNTTAERFWELLLAAKPTHLVEGRAFNFGKGRGGTVERLREWCGRDGIGFTLAADVTATLLDCTVVSVSSSFVRWLIARGRVRDAARCLGRPYAIEGVVVEGRKLGRTIEVPTANLRVDDQLLPDDGIYAASAEIGGKRYAVALSIGSNPTVNGTTRTVEGHVLDFAGDLYGKTLRYDLHDRVRDMWKMTGLAELKAQIARDVAATRAVVAV